MKLPRAVLALQDRLAALLGCEPESRVVIVDGMLHRSPKEATGYWLQLVVAAGIATFGLVLGSTAVVIGAMLVAPLMGPIISFGMGLAIGSPFLVIRGAVRVALSVCVVVLFAAGVTRLLPFHEVNAEIAARTTPTALDLATAVFCAVAGVYAAMRPASDVATTAAGTSIGISLVPPLCVCGYGVGTAGWSIASGASLLFVTNFVAIVFVSTVAFAAAGFGQVDPSQLDNGVEESALGRFSAAVAGRLSRLLHSSPLLRLFMPLALLAAVYGPLRRGLDEVAWQIESRARVEASIAELPRRVVESRIRVDRHQIEIVLFLLGAPSDAAQAHDQLMVRLRDATGVIPRIEVYSVPDAEEFAALEQSLQKPAPPAAPTPAPAPTVSPSERLSLAHDLLRGRVEARWPSETAGPPLAIDVASESGAVDIRVVHLGSELDATAVETLERTLADDLGSDVRLTDTAIPPRPIDLADATPTTIARLGALIAASRKTPTVRACVTLTAAKNDKKPGRPKQAPPDEWLREAFAGHPRVDFAEGAGPSVSFLEGPCEPEEPKK